MRVKYQRTSTLPQHGLRFSEDSQKYDLVLFDRGVSGTLRFKERTEASKVIPLVENNEVSELVVEELRDIGRNMPDTIETLSWLDKNGVNVTIKSMGVSSRVNGEKNKIWTILSATLSAVYELERESLLSRTKAGREAFVRSGGKLGRRNGTTESIRDYLNKPKSLEIISLLEKGKSVRDIAGRLKCSLNTVIKVRKNYLPEEQLRKEVRVNYNGLNYPIADYLKEYKQPQIVKWLGSKESELQYILPELPNSNTYFEPFVGGGSVYTSIIANQYFINDKSDELISLYNSLQSANQEFIRYLSEINKSWKLIDTLFDDNIKFFEQECANYLQGKIKKQELTTRIYEFVIQHSASFFELFEEIVDKKQGNFLLEIKNSIEDKLSRIKKLKVKNEKIPVLDAIETALKGAFYYHLRSIYNKKEEYKLAPELSAALFFFIKQYCFSGMSRYDGSGNFNVAYSGRSYNRKYLDKKINYFTSGKFQNLLSQTSISNLDFMNFFSSNPPSENDFVFLDPPYDETFSSYSNNAFNKDDHKRLANYLINDCKAKWMMVIKKTEFIQGLYSQGGLTIKPFKKKYIISIKNRNNQDTDHLLIKNY